MYTHTLTSICGALILAGVATVIGFEGIATARPEDGSLQIVNRTQKGDRLPLAQINIPRAPVSDASLPEGCDSSSVLSLVPIWHASLVVACLRLALL